MRAATIVALALGAEAFLKPAAPKAATQLAAYVPSGMSPEEYAKLKKREADAKKKKNFGAGGARGLESRSMASFMRAQERGEAEHLFPVDPAKVRTGERTTPTSRAVRRSSCRRAPPAPRPPHSRRPRTR